MLYITWSETDMNQFLSEEFTREIVVVDPVFQHLQRTMDLTKDEVPVVDKESLTPFMLNTEYVQKNKPLLV